MREIDLLQTEYDYVIIGSGFGGSVSALRLSEKGYKVLVIEKGKWFTPNDFPKTNWQIKRWLWVPAIKTQGIMRLSFFRHLNIIAPNWMIFIHIIHSYEESLIVRCFYSYTSPSTFIVCSCWSSIFNSCVVVR